jgi:hypothetical protein
MFWFLLRVKALNRLGFTKPLRTVFLVALLGALAAGLIYSYVVFNALNERRHVPHVQHNLSH